MVALIRINAADVQLDGIEADVALPTEWLDRALSDTEVRARSSDEPAGRLTARLSRSKQDIIVRGRVTAAVEMPCTRCLEPVAVAIDTELSLLLQPRPRASAAGRRPRRGQSDGGEYAFSAAEAEFDVYDGDTIVLDHFVREAIVLEVPTYPLCRDNCPGIPTAESDEPEPFKAKDPRMAPLEAYRNYDEGGPTTVETLVAAAAERAAELGRKPILRAHRGGRRRKRRKGS